jgi:hypothetical protein
MFHSFNDFHTISKKLIHMHTTTQPNQQANQQKQAMMIFSC